MVPPTTKVPETVFVPVTAAGGAPACAAGASVASAARRVTTRMVRRRIAISGDASGSLLGQPDGAIGEDVLLDLGSTSADRRVALEDEEPVPRAVVDGVGAALLEDPGGAEEVDGQLGQGLGEVAPLQLGQWDLGPGLLALQHLGQGPVVEQARELDLRVGLGDAGPEGGVLEGVGVLGPGQ